MREVHITSCQFTCLLLTFDVFQFHQYYVIRPETIFLDEKRYQDAVDIKHKIISVDTVKDIVVALHAYLSLHAMGLPHASDLENILASYHGLAFIALIVHSLDMRTQLVESYVDILVSTVDLLDVVDAARTIGTHRCNEQSNTRTDIRTRHT